MGKSSSSKRKRSNASSSVRSRKSARSKSGRTKSKKTPRGRHIVSDSRSLSSSSDSYSSSGDNHRRRRRSRSFPRKDGRKSRTRVHRDSYSYSSDEGSTPPKKRKDSKRKGDSWTMRKSVKKRYRRDQSVSSASRRSSSCANRSSSEDDYEHHRGRSERKESRVGLENRQRRDRSHSRSSCSRSSCSHSSCGGCSMLGEDRSEERAIVGNSMRLRSVIFVVNAEDVKLEGKENEEEIVFDKDDYPSSRSDDSYHHENKKEVAHHSHVFSDKVFSESEKGKGVEPSGRGGNWPDKNQGNSKIFDGSGHNDLETVLRQRALQNLQKLRGIKKIETNRTMQEPTVAAPEGLELSKTDLVSATGATPRDSSEDVAERSKITKEKTVYARPGEVHAVKQSGSPSEAVVKRIAANNLRQEARPTVAPVLNNPWKKAYTWRRETALIQPPVKRLISPQKPNPPLQMKTQTIRSTNAARSFHNEPALSQQQVKELNSLQKLKTTQAKPTVTETTSPASIAESSRDESASCQPPPKELGLPQEPKPPQAKPVVTETVTAISALESPHNGIPAASLSRVPQKSSLPTDQSTLARTTPGAVSSEKIADEANEGPQYEQKTMSVTRGGETIQVNYQVYIPRRAPAQARRQLKRDS